MSYDVLDHKQRAWINALSTAIGYAAFALLDKEEHLSAKEANEIAMAAERAAKNKLHEVMGR